MSLSYTYQFEVPASAIDTNGHVNNVAYVQWMQDAAIAHSDAVGGTAATRAMNATWVVRRHTIEYRRPAFAGDKIDVRTWVTDCRMVSSRRKYEFIRHRFPPDAPGPRRDRLGSPRPRHAAPQTHPAGDAGSLQSADPVSIRDFNQHRAIQATPPLTKPATVLRRCGEEADGRAELALSARTL